jgi:Rrf2 family protein
MTSNFAVMVHCLSLLAVNSHKLLSSREIARSMHVHPARIRNILSQLDEKGFVSAREGKGGGFQIACEPGLITLDEIYKMSSQNLLNPRCPDCDKSCSVGRNIENVLNGVFEGATAQLIAYFNTITLKDILKRVKK